MNAKRLIIISNEEKISNMNIYDETFDMNIPHQKKFQDYCLKYHIQVPLDENVPGQAWGFYLAKQGFVVVSIEEELAILYIPEEMSFNQFVWFDLYDSLLEQYHVRGFIYQDGKKILMEKDKEKEESNPLIEIKEMINHKYQKEKCYVSRIRY